MKKALFLFLCTGLLTNSVVSAAMSFKRSAECAWAPKKNNCTEDERKAARKWFIAIPVALGVAALAAIGVKASSDAVKEAKQEQAALDTKESYLRDEYTQLGLRRAQIMQDSKTSGEDASLLQIRLTPVKERMAEITAELAALRSK